MEEDQFCSDFNELDDDWIDDEKITCSCLFCNEIFDDSLSTFVHCQKEHGFHIRQLVERFSLDCISYIQLINYIRSSKCEPKMFHDNSCLQSSDCLPWQDEKFMKPVLEDDPLLYFDIEELPTELLTTNNATPSLVSNEDDEKSIQLTITEYNDLRLRAERAESRSTQLSEAVDTLTADMEKLRAAAHGLLSDDDPNTEVVMEAASSADETSVNRLRLNYDQLYIDSYTHFSIHEDMLKDLIRTHSYRDCMYKNRSLFKDKVVLDVGCGLGILSMFAASAGASLVIAVDQSEVIFHAMDIIRENGFEKKIKLIHGKMEEVKLPVEKVDVIISEWMGYFLLFESMLDTVLWARNAYLNPNGGLVLPDRCSIHLLGLQDSEMHKKRVSFWDDVSGFKMSCMKNVILSEPDVCVVDSEKVLTSAALIKSFDILTCLYKDLEFSSPFSFDVLDTGSLHALVGYFDVEFLCPEEKIQFSTGPFSEPTHWKQTVFLLDQPLDVVKGESITGVLTLKKKHGDPRCLLITITINSLTYSYCMD